METIVRDEILKTLDRMPHDRLRRALDLIRAMDAETPHGTRGRDLLDLAGTLSAEDAAEMLRVIEEEFERVDTDDW